MKKLIILFQHSVLILLLLTINSCHNGETRDSEAEGVDALNNPAIEISLTRNQFNEASMELGKPDLHLFKNVVKTNGYIVNSPNGLSRVSPLINGRVKKILVNLGEQVKTGQGLFLLEGNDIISLQLEYAEAIASIDMLSANFKRQEELLNENIGSKKEFTRAKSEYNSALAVISGLEARLKILSINPDEVALGKVSTTIIIAAPIDGSVTDLNLVRGEYIEINETALEITDRNKLLLQINVFEKDIDKIQEGLKVGFYSPDSPEVYYEGLIQTINQSIDGQNRTIKALVSFQNKGQGNLFPGRFVESEIFLDSKERMALPASACFRDGDAYYVLQLYKESNGEMHFIKTYLNIGTVGGDYLEVKNIELDSILIKGGFNIVIEE